MKRTRWISSAVSMLMLCGCSGGGGAASGNTATNTVRAPSGGEVRTGGGTGAPVTVTANQRFEQAAQAMRTHDEANEGRGDWTPGTCNEVAGQFEAAANAQTGGAFPEAWFNRGLVFERCNMTNESRQALQRALEVARNNNYCRARAQLGVLEYRANQRDQARATFQRAIEQDQNCVEAYTNLALLQREAGDQANRQLAVQNIRQALARDDRYVPALNQLALVYLADAGDDPHSQRLFLAGLVCSQALQVVTQHRDAIAADVRGFSADVYNTWGLVSIRAGQIIRALEFFRNAYQRNPTMFEAWVNYGTINLSFRGYRDAKDAFEHATQLRPNDYDAHIGLGVALRGLGQIDDAQREYERAQQIDNNRPDAYYNLGVLWESYRTGSRDDLVRAKGLLEQFITKAGATPRYADAVTRARQHIRNIDQTITQLDQVAAVQAMAARNQASSGGADAGAAAPAPAADAGATPTTTTGADAGGGG